MLTALCLEDSPRDVEIMRELLLDAGFDLDMDCAAVEKEFVSLLRSKTYDIILADFKLPGFDAFAALRWSKEICPNVPFICVSGSIGEEIAVELLKQGAVDYVLKDRLAKLPSAIKRALGEAKEKESRRRVEETLQKSERRLREAQEMAHLGFWTWDVMTGEVEWSEEVFKIFCLDPKEFTPHIDSILALSPWPEDHQRDQELIKKAIETHNPGSYEQKFLRPNQSIGYYNSTFQGNYDEKGDLISIVGTVLDITERKRAEEVLKESEQRFKGIFDKARDGMLLTDAESRKFYMINSSMSEMLGYKPDEISNVMIDDIHPKETLPYVLEQFRKLSTDEISIAENIPVKKKDGSIFYADITVSFIEIGNHNYIVGFFRDITGRKNAEEKISHQLVELRRWQDVMLGREDRIRQLKHEVNELLNRLGDTIRYPSQESDTAKDQPNEAL